MKNKIAEHERNRLEYYNVKKARGAEGSSG